MGKNKGFITIQRKILDWEWYDDIPTKVLFIHLLIKANFETKMWRGIEIKRGEYLTSREKLAEETGLSSRQVRTALKHLEVTGEVTSKTTSHYTLIFLTKYDFYQRSSDQQKVQQTTSKRPASDQQPTTTNKYNNNYNNEKEKESVLPDEPNGYLENEDQEEEESEWFKNLVDERELREQRKKQNE